ncbi:MAG: hypothetical protein PGN30_09835 [Mycolicibacterium neoaurum]|uniref:hypothetical protein n=1 Tax=Mycolicibacterium neoaurum TaxID=1795 RepID=UPI002FF5299F
MARKLPEIEHVSPSDVAVDDVLFFARSHDSEFGLVTAVQHMVKHTHCDVMLMRAHDFDAYHFTCDVFGQDGDRRGTREVCEPTAALIGDTVHWNNRVSRSVQKS